MSQWCLIESSLFRLKGSRRRWRVLLPVWVIVFFGGGSIAPADDTGGSITAAVDKIRGNLFLMSEAYNQEEGVAQLHQRFLLNPRIKGWSYRIGSEFPLFSPRNQLSLTFSGHKPDDDSSFGIHDLLLGYQFQITGGDRLRLLAMASRISLVIPTGAPLQGARRGVLGVQLALPISLDLGRYFSLHFSGDVTLTPGARSSGDYQELAVDTSGGVGVVYFPFDWMNPLVEVFYQSTEIILDSRESLREGVLQISPGIRFSLEFLNGAQIVPGLAAPIQLGPNGEREYFILGYLSFESPLAFLSGQIQ